MARLRSPTSARSQLSLELPRRGGAAETRNALAYVLLNHRSHRARAGEQVGRGKLDRFSSAACLDGWAGGIQAAPPRVTSPPTTWLLARGWWRRGLLSPDEIPAGPAHLRLARSDSTS